MKILMITEYYPPIIKGGGEISCEEFVKSLKKKGHYVRVFTSGKENGFFARLFLEWKIKRSLKRMLKYETFDMVYCYNNTGIRAVANLDIPKRVILNSYVALCPKGDLLYKDTVRCQGCNPNKMKRCFAGSRVIGKMKMNFLFRSAPVRKMLYHMYKKRLEAMKGFVIDTRNKHTVRLLKYHHLENNFGQVEKPIVNIEKDDRKTYLYVGALDYRKGVDKAIEYFNYIKRKKKRFFIVGEGLERKRLEALVKSLYLEESVFFVGWQERIVIDLFFGVADVFLFFPRWYEPHSRSVEEAKLRGIKIISNNVGGNFEE